MFCKLFVNSRMPAFFVVGKLILFWLAYVTVLFLVHLHMTYVHLVQRVYAEVVQARLADSPTILSFLFPTKHLQVLVKLFLCMHEHHILVVCISLLIGSPYCFMFIR